MRDPSNEFCPCGSGSGGIGCRTADVMHHHYSGREALQAASVCALREPPTLAPPAGGSM